MSYRIKTVAEMTGIARNTLIAWERRYGFVVPVRAANGYRVYTDRDVQVLYEIKRLLDEGFKISEAVRLLEERGISSGPVTPGTLDETGKPVEDRVRDELLAALLAFDEGTASRLTGRLGLVPYEDQLDRVWFPMLREVGRGWAEGEISVVQEHFASAFCMTRMRSMLLSVQGAAQGERSVVCAGMPGERHELGLLGLAIRFSLRGWRVVYLGMDTPTEELVAFAQARPSDLLCVSVVCGQEAEDVHALAGELRQGAPASVHLVLGGRGIPEGLAPQRAGVDYHRRSSALLASPWVSPGQEGEE